MKSIIREDFIAAFGRLPKRIQRQARKNYQLWAADPAHPSLEFKRVGVKPPVLSIRVGLGWRALGRVQKDTITWFWIGSHAEYDRLLKDL